MQYNSTNSTTKSTSMFEMFIRLQCIYASNKTNCVTPHTEILTYMEHGHKTHLKQLSLHFFSFYEGQISNTFICFQLFYKIKKLICKYDTKLVEYLG